MYPTVAGKIVSHGPYKSVADLYSISGLTEAEKSVMKKYESKFVTLDPAPEYQIDRINNVSSRVGREGGTEGGHTEGGHTEGGTGRGNLQRMK
eukprot:evm.model.NODE_25201_length_48748_cov_29.326208.4